ncbi:MAG: putative porin [Deltaproteobacteria bacterium]|nr:putative porin [Deltaproteobacteria bacterium]
MGHGKSKVLLLLLMTVMVFGSMIVSNPAYTEENVDIGAILKTLGDLQTTIEKQNAEIERLKNALHELSERQDRAKEEQQNLIQANVRKEVEEQVKPLEWAKRLSLSGDMRLRYEGRYNRKDNSGQDVEDRNRFRVRLRLYGDAKISDELAAHYMLSTSDNQFGQTSNQTLDDEFDNKAIFIARAYGDYRPKWLPGLEVGFGKFKNPYLHSTISFDPDVNPEGFYELYQYKGWETVQPFVKLGQIMISENDLTKDASLFLWQGGVGVNFKPVQFTFGGSYYDYTNLERSRLGESKRAFGNTTTTDPETGGPILAYDFRIAEAIGFADFKLLDYPVTLWADYLKNTADEVPEDTDSAWGAGLTFGKAKQKGEWSFEYSYRYIQANAVLGLFSDGDFLGTDKETHWWRFTYRLFKPFSVQAAFFDTDSIDGEVRENRFQLSTFYYF